jgi:hypothetical protein
MPRPLTQLEILAKWSLGDAANQTGFSQDEPGLKYTRYSFGAYE